MTNIILCGGSGTRLWPISRALMPKQFLKLFDDTSLFQLTVQRNQNFCNKQLIVSNADQYFLALDQLEELGESTNADFLLEPVGRNTAPAIALASMLLDPDEIVLVTPSDHFIKDQKNYEKVLTQAKELASGGDLVTFGIKPQYAETGYGYIESDAQNVKAFHEKPDAQTAQSYIDKGNFYWNSGMFCFKAGVYLEELKKHAPEIYQSSLKAFKSAKKSDMLRITHDAMLDIPDQSIDYAVMEKSDRVKVVASEIGWSDIGSFDALEQEYQKDENNNTQSDALFTLNAHNNFVYAKNKAVALNEVDDLIVVETEDVVMISKKGSSQNIKKLVSMVKEKQPELALCHQTTYRPWGAYTVLEDKPGYKIKRIVVKPGLRFSLQKHLHRNEHWIIISGTATVTVGENTQILRANESTYIKMGELHRLANEGKIPVVLIEVQVGAYTGEDDIVRIEDDFNRA